MWTSTSTGAEQRSIGAGTFTRTRSALTLHPETLNMLLPLLCSHGTLSNSVFKVLIWICYYHCCVHMEPFPIQLSIFSFEYATTNDVHMEPFPIQLSKFSLLSCTMMWPVEEPAYPPPQSWPPPPLASAPLWQARPLPHWLVLPSRLASKWPSLEVPPFGRPICESLDEKGRGI